MFDPNDLVTLDHILEAIRENNADKVEFLVERAQKQSLDLNGYANKYKYGTLLHFAVLKCRGEDSKCDEEVMLRIVNTLCEAGIDVNKPGDDSGKYYPLHIAARRALPAIVKCLLDNGAKPHLTDAKNKTPLDLIKQAINKKKSHQNIERDSKSSKCEIGSKEFQGGIIQRLEEVEDLLKSPPTPKKWCHIV